MYKILFISQSFEPFLSHWGSLAIPQPHEDGYIIPLGWEEELTNKGIEFKVIEIKEDESRDL